MHAPEGIAGLDEAPDTFFRDGDRLPGGLRAVLAPGPKGPIAPFISTAAPARTPDAGSTGGFSLCGRGGSRLDRLAG